MSVITPIPLFTANTCTLIAYCGNKGTGQGRGISPGRKSPIDFRRTTFAPILMRADVGEAMESAGKSDLAALLAGLDRILAKLAEHYTRNAW